MIKIENMQITGWDATIRGMRNHWKEFCQQIRELQLFKEITQIE